MMDTRSDENRHSELINLSVFKEILKVHTVVAPVTENGDSHQSGTGSGARRDFSRHKSMFDFDDSPSEITASHRTGRRSLGRHLSMFNAKTIAKHESPRTGRKSLDTQLNDAKHSDIKDNIWIGNTFFRKECVRFVPITAGSHQCYCGRTIKQHRQGSASIVAELCRHTSVVNDRYLRWESQRDVEKLRTDAFGEVDFHHTFRSKKPSKYIRLSDDTDPKLILELLMDVWKLPRPKLVISVSGGHKNCKLKPQQITNFTNALEKASHNEGTWILTCGTNYGVTKLVGDAVENGQSLKMEGCRVMQTINCIGIAPWGYVENKEDLINEKDTGVYGAIKHGLFHSKLNPNHTHYILVDNGTVEQGPYFLKMRSKIEAALLAEDIPLVLLLLEGGQDNIQHVHDSLHLGVPTVVCNGSGRAADIISYAHKHAGNVDSGVHELTDDNAIHVVENMIHVAYGVERRSVELYTMMNKINRIVCKNMITVFEMGNDSDVTAFRGGPSLSELIVEFAKHSWIVTHFQKKACIRYVRAPSPSTNTCNIRCHCGRTEYQHRKQQMDQNEREEMSGLQEHLDGDDDAKWNPEENLVKCPTDAFGEISFTPKAGNGKNPSPAKYIRLEEDTDPKLIINLLMKHWNLPRPKLVISVTGGRKNLELSHEDRKNFNTALKKASQTACTWILTGGTNCGATQCVGEAVREGQSIKWEGNKAVKTINCIGFAPWGYVDDTDCLVRKRGPGLYHTEYSYLKPVTRGKPVPLNPNHTHFILVDDGRKNRSGGADLQLRSKIEKTILEENIPLVLVVLEGGKEALTHLKDSTDIRVPAVICNGTGRAADIVSFVHNNVEKIPERRLESDSPVLKELKSTLVRIFGMKEESEEMEELVEDIYSCVKDKHLITVFEMGRERNSDMNLAIMTALLDGHCATFYQQLSLAISWNRVDIAERIFATDMNFCVKNEFITHALVDNKVEFVKLFIGRRSTMKNYLTVARLSQLYNNEVDVDDILHIMSKVKNQTCTRPIYLKDVRNLLRFLIGADKPVYLLDNPSKRDVVKRGISDTVLATALLKVDTIITFLKGVYDDFRQPDNAQSTDTDFQKEYGDEYLEEIAKPDLLFEQPFTEMFLWAAITNRVEMAEFFWEQGSNPVSSAIAASKFLHTIHKLTKDSDRKETNKINAKLFEDLATDVIDECYHTNKKLARMVIESPHPHWKHKSPLLMAAEAENKDFISHPCCKSLLDEKWYGQLSPSHNRSWQVLLALLTIYFPVMIIFKLQFKDQKGEQPRFYKKLGIFFRAPVTKFWIHLISYALFLLLYSYMLLFQFSTKPDVLTVGLCVWIVTMVFEEIRELFNTRVTNETLSQAFRKFVGSKRNLMDVAMLTTGLAGFALQWFEVTHEWGRTLHAANSFVLFSRVLRYFAVSEKLGPKMVMIGKMIYEMLLFMSILSVFLVSYGIASQALLYPKQKLSFRSFKQIFFMPYFQIYGELFLDNIGGDCEYEDTDLCPQEHWLVPILLGIYLLLGNVLLLNLLIAIFSSVYAHVERNSFKIWKYEWYFLVMELKHCPILPPPFIIIPLIWRLFGTILTKCKCRRSKKSMDVDIDIQNLHIFEQDCLANYISKKAEEQNVTEMIDRMEKAIEKRLTRMDKTMEKRMDAIGKGMDRMMNEMKRHEQRRSKETDDCWWCAPTMTFTED